MTNSQKYFYSLNLDVQLTGRITQLNFKFNIAITVFYPQIKT